MDIKQINVLVLAYIGDSVYELYIRNHLAKTMNHVNKIEKEKIKYVSAKGQAQLVEKMIASGFLSDEEIDLIKRGRNAKVTSKPKSTDILTYKHATAFEVLIGYLYLENNIKRLEEIIDYVKGEIK